MNPYFLQKYAQLRHDDFLVEAEHERLIRSLSQKQPRFDQRLQERLGDWLIEIGYKLKAQPPRPLWEQGYQGKNL